MHSCTVLLEAMPTTFMTVLDVHNNQFVEFQRWWVLKSKMFGQESTYSKEKNVKNSVDGHDFSNKVVQKLTLEKNVEKMVS